MATRATALSSDILLGDGVADRGDAQAVATQSGVDIFLDYLVVGDPDDLTLTVVGGDTIQEGMDAADCEDLDSTDFVDEIAAPEVTGLVATVVDDDGTELAGIYDLLRLRRHRRGQRHPGHLSHRGDRRRHCGG